ncbi:MAG TPA: alpha/beta hydrolase [Steroidobacteraceae bacterium]|nr:alpha/beta hydrolase [Steroidobacteraceae bacterium]
MIHGRLVVVAALALLACSACSRQPESGAPPASATADNSNSNAAPRVEGAPEIATEPDGVHIEYHTYGHGEPAVVLIHGWATDANYWSAQLEPLKSKYTVVTVDLAGHGASTRNRADWSMGNYGEDVATVVRQIQNKQVILVGHSMGGTVALEAARRIGDRVIGIIVVDALKSIGLPPLSASEIDMRVAPFRTDFIGQTRKYVTESLFAPGADPVFVQKVAYDMSLEPPEVAVPSLQALLSMDFATVLPAIHVPVLAINSDLTPTDETRIRRFLPDFKADVLPHTGHFLMMEAPQTFNPVLLRDIDTLTRRASH